jgi:hypothetical protein
VHRWYVLVLYAVALARTIESLQHAARIGVEDIRMVLWQRPTYEVGISRFVDWRGHDSAGGLIARITHNRRYASCYVCCMAVGIREMLGSDASSLINEVSRAAYLSMCLGMRHFSQAGV